MFSRDEYLNCGFPAELFFWLGFLGALGVIVSIAVFMFSIKKEYEDWPIYGNENFEDRFPSYLFVRVLKLPTEVIKLNNVKPNDCGEHFDNDKFVCLKIEGKNYYKVDREITIRYKNKRGNWYIDYLSF